MSLNERWGHQQRGNGGRRVRKKMVLLQVVLLLIVVVGWSNQMSFTHATHCVPSSLPNSQKIKHITIAIQTFLSFFFPKLNNL
jgi:hypothetical protein